MISTIKSARRYLRKKLNLIELMKVNSIWLNGEDCCNSTQIKLVNQNKLEDYYY